MFRLLSAIIVFACPVEMVQTGTGACIDRFPLGQPGAPILGLSALPNNYLDLRGETWDAEALCAMHGKRLCTWDEWRSACRGTQQLPLVAYIAPDWRKVERHDGLELWRLNQYPSALDNPQLVGWSGARMMTAAEEWVRYQGGYAFSRGYWSREGGCDSITVGHDPRWWSFVTTARCCLDLV